MAKLIILGSSNAIPSEKHENTHMALLGDSRVVLIDCVSNPILRLRTAGHDFNELTDLILTHFHPDHISGVPLLLMNMWLLGRSDPLYVYGLPDVKERFETMMDLFRWAEWPGFFPVACRVVTEEVGAQVLEDQGLRITSAPV